MQKDTIFALSTPQGVGGVAVIRISGPQAQAALQALFQPAGTSPMEPRKLIYGRFVFDGTQIDDGMAVLFCAPASYTGEDSAELHCHGSLAVVQQLLGALGTLPGLRPAEPGEFTKRAFLHGKMDLSQAEAVMDLIGAEGLAAARQSLSQLHGTLFAKVDGICDALTLALAGIEAGLDFPEDDWEQAANEEGFASMSQILTEVTALLRSYRAGRLVKQGVRCALVGRPNAGKSSLLNAAAGFERALVSEQAGTTRDIIEEAVQVDGIVLRLYDTAGIHDNAEGLEARGIDLGLSMIQNCDVAVLVVDGAQPLPEEDEALLSKALEGRPFVVALNKADFPWQLDVSSLAAHWPKAAAVLSCSCQSGEGIFSVLQAALLASGAQQHEASLITNARHAACLERAQQGLTQALEAYQAGLPADIAAEDARQALKALGEITGKTVSEEVIDEIFATFCVGK